jgi:hypothetical protein
MKAKIIWWVFITALAGWILFMIHHTWHMTQAERLTDPLCWISFIIASIVYSILRKWEK